MSDTERITVRLSAEKLQALQSMVDDGQYDTLSEVIRSAIDAFLEEHYTPEYIERVTVELPKGNVIELESLVQEGDSVSLDDAIRNAVREYTRKRISRAIEEIE